MTDSKMKYDLFISYATDPDYRFARKLEQKLESFHRTKVDAKYILKPLKVCRDGSDFELKKLVGNGNADESIKDDANRENALTPYLESSKNLLVLCSRNAAESKWVRFEIDWFLKNRPREKIFLAITEGAELKDVVFPKSVLDSNLKHEFAFDFRGGKREARNWSKRDFDEQWVNLASQLNGYSTGDLHPSWKRSERLRKTVTLVGFGGCFNFDRCRSVFVFGIPRKMGKRLESVCFRR